MHLQLGLTRIKGLRQETAERVVSERAKGDFLSIDDFLVRVDPDAREKRILAKSGALNELPEVQHRREALWQAELSLYDDLLLGTSRTAFKMAPMNLAERLAADYSTQGASSGPHPMALWRKNHGTKQILRAKDLTNLPHGLPVIIAGLAICRQRPGTANGHCFISLEDETGVANLFVPKTTFHTYRRVITAEPFLRATGRLQRSEGDQPTVYVVSVEPLGDATQIEAPKAHDFH